MVTDLNDIYKAFLESNGVTTDSRNCPEGAMFIALRGERFNGNQYAAKALQGGCSCAVVDDASCCVAGDSRYLLVDNCLQTLQQLANMHRRALGTRLLAITGTNGKTTTKELTAAVLSRKFDILYTQGNLNNHIGVPLTLLNLRAEHDMAIVEMGASHPGEIAELVELVCPDYGLITNVGKAHLEGFGSFQGVIDTKTALYRYLQAHDGCVFYQSGNEILAPLARQGRSVAYVEGHCLEGQAYAQLQWQGKQGRHLACTQLIGAYNQDNLLAAATIGLYFGVNEDDINRALEAYQPSNNRSQWMQTARNRLIVDAYNANPSSMNVALDNFLNLSAPKRAVILGAMRELGAYSLEEHQNILRKLCRQPLAFIYLVGEEFHEAYERLPREELLQNQDNIFFFSKMEDCRACLEAHQVQDCLILVKGSHSNHLERLIDLL